MGCLYPAFGIWETKRLFYTKTRIKNWRGDVQNWARDVVSSGEWNSCYRLTYVRIISIVIYGQIWFCKCDSLVYYPSKIHFQFFTYAIFISIGGNVLLWPINANFLFLMIWTWGCCGISTSIYTVVYLVWCYYPDFFFLCLSKNTQLSISCIFCKSHRFACTLFGKFSHVWPLLFTLSVDTECIAAFRASIS